IHFDQHQWAGIHLHHFERVASHHPPPSVLCRFQEIRSPRHNRSVETDPVEVTAYPSATLGRPAAWRESIGSATRGVAVLVAAACRTGSRVNRYASVKPMTDATASAPRAINPAATMISPCERPRDGLI